MQGGLRERNTSQPGPQDRRARRDFKILMLGPLTGLVTSDVLGYNPAAVCSKGPQESPTHSKEPGPLARGSELTGRSHLLRAKSVIQARSRGLGRNQDPPAWLARWGLLLRGRLAESSRERELAPP